MSCRLSRDICYFWAYNLWGGLSIVTDGMSHGLYAWGRKITDTQEEEMELKLDTGGKKRQKKRFSVEVM